MRFKLLGTFLTGSCFVVGTIAGAEPVSTKPVVKKHPECQETKHKTTCKHQAEMKDFVTSRQAPSTPGPIAGADKVANSLQSLPAASADSAATQAPK